MEFTKEQLIAKAREQIAFCRNTKITGEGRAHVNQCSALFEIALELITSEPFMYAIEDEDGKPHMTEFCVSTSRSSLQDEVDAIDGEARHEDERDLYKVVPVYRLPLLEELK
ncbi:hypothetical protein [Enterobacter hormaechei]|uniref:hypothetical protein n=1 Tax=Enterobacter hormaechei TaxID=158836 RepID=UPI00163C1BEF|nr:hypothetical protein [Enterobacter hormaechei]